jgi:pimeloyl-[acyl-carrier protein] methyl ester esterase
MSAHVESVGAGAPLVLLHGWGLHGGLFAPLLPGLARRFPRARRRPAGHGHSPAVATRRSTRSSTRWPTRSRTSAGRSRCWAGRSGAFARCAGRARSRAVARLVLVATSPRFVSGDDWPHAMSATTLARFGDEFAASWKLTMQRFLALQVHGSESGRATLAALRHQLFARGEPSRAALGDALRVLATSDLRGEVGAIDAPTLVVSGERDTLAPAAAGAWLGRSDAARDATCASTARRTRRSCRTGKRSIARSTVPRWPLIRRRPIRARPSRAPCAARSRARRRATTRRPRCSAR